jgi:hypothetical protein
MNLTDEQREALYNLGKPIIKWLNDNTHPHTKVIITTDSFELLEGIIGRQTDEFIKD